MIKNWPRKLMFIGIGASLLIWTSGGKLTESLAHFAYEKGGDWDLFIGIHHFFEARYPLAIAIAVTVFAVYLTFGPKNSN